MPYDPAIHHRHSIRLKGYDYSQEGLYFITICCQGRICRFGKIEDGKMILNDTGNIAQQCWLDIPQHFPLVELHEYVVMPNHNHGIVEFIRAVAVEGAGTARPSNSRPSESRPDNSEFRPDNWGINIGEINMGRANPAPTIAPTLGNVIGYFKYQATKKIDLPDKLWQRNYYEHIIRNEQAYQNISNYIIHNPETWRNDQFYSE
jgi:REP element-mobilizing transposase RayT